MSITFPSAIQELYNKGADFVINQAYPTVVNQIYPAVKETAIQGKDFVVNEIYPAVKEAAVKYGQPTLGYLKARAVEYPLTALVTANVAIVYSAFKVANYANNILSTAFCGFFPTKLTRLPFTLGVIGAANYFLYKGLELSLPLEISVGVPAVTFCAYVIINKLAFAPSQANNLKNREITL